MVKSQIISITPDELKAHRLSTDLSQTKIAEALGMHWNTYARIERGERGAVVDARTAIPVLLIVAAWHAKKRDRLAPEFGRLLPGVVEIL